MEKIVCVAGYEKKQNLLTLSIKWKRKRGTSTSFS